MHIPVVPLLLCYLNPILRRVILQRAWLKDKTSRNRNMCPSDITGCFIYFQSKNKLVKRDVRDSLQKSEFADGYGDDRRCHIQIMPLSTILCSVAFWEKQHFNRGLWTPISVQGVHQRNTVKLSVTRSEM